MILGAEIGLAIIAIYALITGKLPLTRNRIVYGWKARVLALFGLMPFPVAFTIGLAIGIFTAAQGQPVNRDFSLTGMMIVMELTVVVMCVAAMYGIGWALATGPPPPPKRRRREEADDDDSGDEPASEQRTRGRAEHGRTDDAVRAGPVPPRGGEVSPTAVAAGAARPMSAPRRDTLADAGDVALPPRRSASTAWVWVVALLGAGGLGVCCLGVIDATAYWTLRAQPRAAPNFAEQPPAAVIEERKAIIPDPVVPPPVEKKPRPRLKLPAPPPVLAIEPTRLREKTKLTLPAPVTQIVAGGGGRFLLLHLASQNKIGLFDANSGDISHYFSVDADTVFTAGMNKLITWSPSAGAVTRWDLLTRQKEQTLPLTIPGKVTSFCMGSASDWPLLACTEQQFRLLEIDGFTALEVPDDERGQPIGQLANNNYWAGGAGRVFGRSGRLGMPNGVGAFVLDTDWTKLTYQHQSTFYVVPGPDGQHIWSGGQCEMCIEFCIERVFVYL
jgi:hypothetical protein